MILEDFIAFDFLLESARDPMTDLPRLMRECGRVIETAQEALETVSDPTNLTNTPDPC